MTMRIIFMICVVTMASMLLNSESCFSQEISVTNVSYSMRDSDVVVHYDLNGPIDKQYKIQLILRRESQSSFKMLPMDISGDVGTGTFSGQNREIVWHLYEDIPYGLDGNDFYFEVNATLLGAEKGGASWLYYAGGALVAGAAAVFFGTDLFKKAGGASQLPNPPSRP